MSRKNTNQPEYGTELKLAAVRGALAGESVSAVAQELDIRRKRLYVWKDRYAELGDLHGVLLCGDSLLERSGVWLFNTGSAIRDRKKSANFLR
jgi:hypothetical protein